MGRQKKEKTSTAIETKVAKTDTKSAEPKMPKMLKTPKVVKAKEPKATKEPKPKMPLVEISCIECGTIRLVKQQDVHQVKRCVACQVKYAKLKRKEYKKNLVKNLRQEIADLRAEINNLTTKVV